MRSRKAAKTRVCPFDTTILGSSSDGFLKEWPPQEYYRFHYHSPYDDDDESDYELETASAGGGGGGHSHGHGRGGEEPQRAAARVRRGSEGWEVRPMSYEDREAMVEAALSASSQAWSPTSSTSPQSAGADGLSPDAYSDVEGQVVHHHQASSAPAAAAAAATAVIQMEQQQKQQQQQRPDKKHA